MCKAALLFRRILKIVGNISTEALRLLHGWWLTSIFDGKTYRYPLGWGRGKLNTCTCVTITCHCSKTILAPHTITLSYGFTVHEAFHFSQCAMSYIETFYVKKKERWRRIVQKRRIAKASNGPFATLFQLIHTVSSRHVLRVSHKQGGGRERERERKGKAMRKTYYYPFIIYRTLLVK